jgi:hypothetical protein
VIPLAETWDKKREMSNLDEVNGKIDEWRYAEVYVCFLRKAPG